MNNFNFNWKVFFWAITSDDIRQSRIVFPLFFEVKKSHWKAYRPSLKFSLEIGWPSPINTVNTEIAYRKETGNERKPTILGNSRL